MKRTTIIAKRALPALATVLCLLAAAIPAYPAGNVQKLGDHLYAYISDNDGSSNSTFLVGSNGIVVVDTGLNAIEGEKLRRAIQENSSLPVRYILNTHYHPDHQGGNGTVGPGAVIISTPFTREQTLQLIAREAKNRAASSSGPRPSLRFAPANLTIVSKITLYVGTNVVEIYAVGAAHTGGDAIAYFPKQGVVATGDVFLTRSCPDIDHGDVRHWVQVLDFILSLQATRFVPGHFEVGSRAQLQQFRDYLADLYGQVQKMYKAGATLEDVKRGIHMEKYSDFRQFPKFRATFADNAAEVYRELAAAPAVKK
ncbi:MAG: MBL fold metallo-hydrolase [Candidatus Acidiferrales bacterium]